MRKLMLPRSIFLKWILVMAVIMSSPIALAASLPDFTELVKDNAAAVVNISTTEKGGNRNTRGLSDQDIQQLPDFLRRFFGDPNNPNQPLPGIPGMPGSPREQHSMGSGFVVSDDGYILTNNHVVDGADEIMVRLNDRRELPAKVVGTDPRSDIAVLKVEAKDLPVVKLGEGHELEPGEWVVAIGSPFGFDYSVTAGIVSAVGRALPNENYVPFIQTDVAINPGNSGGPLFDMDGRVVGVNSQIYTRSGGFMGVSFAIPIDVAMGVFQQIREQGHVSRGWLGVLIQEVNRDLAESFGLDKAHGALVAQVVSGSPAEKAGLQVGDIILAYEGQKIDLSSDLPPRVGRTPVGKAAKVTVLRNGERKDINVTIAELPEDDQALAAAGQEPPKVAANALGLLVEPVPDALRDELNIEGGVRVVQVGDGPALNAGVRVGDVIRSINNEPVVSPASFNKLVEGLPKGKGIPMLIVRQGNPSFIVVKIP